MEELTQEQILNVKAKGFLLNRGTNMFSGRIVPAGCVFSADDLIVVAQIAKEFGNGKVAFTSRLAAEIVGIPYQKIQEAIDFAHTKDLYFGGTGAKIRPIVACKGTTCVYGNFDTQKLAKHLYDKYYLGWGSAKLPHKFKIAIGGCPNSCMKPSLNDFGVEGRKVLSLDLDKCRGCKVCQVEKHCPVKAAVVVEGKLNIAKACNACGICAGQCPFEAVANQTKTMVQIYVGGTWGKTARMGTPLSKLVTLDEIDRILENTMLWFKKYGCEKERLGNVIDRIGVQKMEQEIFGDQLQKQREEILAAPVREKR